MSAAPTARAAARAAAALALPAALAAVAALDMYAEGRWGLRNGVWLALIAAGALWFWALFPRGAATKALLAGSVGATLLGVELLLRLFFSTEYATLYRLDPEFLHSYRPGARRVFRFAPEDGGGRVLTKIDGNGYRDEPPAGGRPERRVLLYGDSYVAAEQSPLPETLAGRLEAFLSERSGRPVEVINAGVTAYGPDQVCVRMREEVPRLAPDLVVVAVYADNDFGDLVRNKLFRLDAGGRLVPTGARVRPALRAEFARARASLLYNATQQAVRVAVRRARARRPAEPAATDVQLVSWLARCEAEYRDRATGDAPEASRIFDDHYDADSSLLPGSESARYKRLLFEGVLARIRSQLAERGIPLVVLVIPSPIDITDFVEGAAVDRRRYPDYSPSGLSDDVVSAASGLGIDCLDLYVPFLARDPRTLYFRKAAHWNARGEEVAADTLAGHILARGYLDGR